MFQAETGGQCSASQSSFQRAAEPDSTTENGSSDAINGSDDVLSDDVLEEQLFYLGSITHNIPDAVVAMDNAYCIRGWNKAAETLFGWQREEVLGKLVVDILPTTFPHNPRGRVEWQVALATEGHWQGEIMLPHRNGTRLDILTTLSLLRDRAGTRIGLVAFHRDITERKKVQEARDQLNVILQSVADGIIVQDANGAIVYTNDVVARLTGFSSATTMLNTHAETMDNLLDKFHLKDETGNFIPDEQLPGRRALRGEKHVQAVVQYEDEASQKRWQLMRAEPILDDSGQVQFAVTVLTDISGQKEMEWRKDEFINMVSHELKTPVTSIKGFAQLLQRRLSHHEVEEAQIFLTRMDTQLNRLTKLINNLLEISRLQTGRVSYTIETFDLYEVVCAAVANMQETVSTHRILLESSAHAQVSGDKYRLDHVFTNLLSNAIKYSPHDSQIIVRMALAHGQVIVSVQDAGTGIAEAHHEKIFERFYQISNPQEKPFSGLGIGLYLSSEIVKRHAGRIWVESQRGEGATFYVALPVAAS